jgi:hypothetical protein
MKMDEVKIEERRELAISQKDIEEVAQQYRLFLDLQRNVLTPNVDYGFPSGKQPRWEGAKASLYKAGAEKLAKIFKLYVNYTPEHVQEDETLVFYRFRADVYHMPSGKIVAHGYGACSSKERKTWDENPLGFANNIVKMARKRAFVDGILTATGASSAFTQDLEDYEEEVEEGVTDKQLKMIHALINEYARITDSPRDEIVNEIKEEYGVEHSTDLSKEQASRLINELQTKIYEANIQKK